MLSKLLKFLLVVTSFAPVFITLWFADFSVNWDITKGWYYLVITVLMVALCFIIMKIAKNKLEKLPVKIQSIKTADKEVISFIVAYLLLPVILSLKILKTGFPILLSMIFWIWKMTVKILSQLFAANGQKLRSLFCSKPLIRENYYQESLQSLTATIPIQSSLTRALLLTINWMQFSPTIRFYFLPIITPRESSIYRNIIGMPPMKI